MRRSCNSLSSCKISVTIQDFATGLVGCAGVTPSPDTEILSYATVVYTCSSTSKLRDFFLHKIVEVLGKLPNQMQSIKKSETKAVE